ncbi:MAG: ATP-binding protein [Gloeobacterales cyanobacterium]
MQPREEQDASNTTSGHKEQRALEVLSSLSYRTGELSRYLQEVAQGVSELIGLDWSTVTLCRNGQERVLASTLDLGESGNQVYSLHGTLTGTVVATGCSLVVEDTATAKEHGEAPDGYRAYLGVPLLMPTGEVIGTICSFHHQPRHFTPEEVKMAEIFAERAATAIDNYQLYQRQQEINKQLEIEIRERKEFEKALQASEERLRQISDNIQQVLWMYAEDGKPLYISPAFEKIWQQSCAHWYENPSIWWEAIHPEDKERVQAEFKQSAEFKEEYRIVRPDGSVRIIFDQAFPIRDEKGRICRIAGIAEDITERKQAQQEMLKAFASLAEVGELAAMIVHELRNPLTTVLMGLNAFKKIPLPNPARERLALSLDEAERIRNLLSEILLYAKPQSLQFSTLELNEFITEILGPIRMMPSAMNRQIIFIPSPTSVHIMGDKDKLKQVFINLIDNACDAVKEGETVTWSVDTDIITQWVDIQIHNGGNPISPELLPKITKPFYTTKSSGTGLGLAIVKRIVDAHGGELSFTSSALEGTIVSVRLPLSQN